MTASEQSLQYDGGNVHTLPPQVNDQQEAAKAEPKERVYYADWVRGMAITLVIFVHCLVNSADAANVQFDEQPTVKQKEDGIIKCLVQIGIPMFFYISGIGATFFDTEKNNYAIFIGGKVLRIIIPFIVGIFVFLIPRLYFGQTYEDFTRVDGEVQPNYWEYMKAILPTVYLKLSWLWYLPALFIDFLICYPLLRWSIRRSK
jgi:surface polysaccharide O-acyltransferase-like enzyme